MRPSVHARNVVFRAAEDLYASAVDAAAARHMSTSEFMRAAVRDAVARVKAEQRQPLGTAGHAHG